MLWREMQQIIEGRPTKFNLPPQVEQLITDPFDELIFTTGKVMFSVILMLDVLVQPLAPVAVMV